MGSKIGIVFAFLLSAAAAFGAYFLYQSFSEERGFRLTLEQKYGEAKDKVQTLQSEKDQFVTEKTQLQSENEEFQRKTQEVLQQAEQVKAESSKAISERDELARQMREKDEKLVAMEKKVAELQRQADEMMRACNITPADLKASLTTAAPMVESQISTMTSSDELTFSSPGGVPASADEGFDTSMTAFQPEVVASPAPDARQAEPLVSGTSSQPAPMASESSGPVQREVSVDAKVLTVNRKFNFVVVNMGLKDGLKIGDQLKVVKGGADSATVQVEKLYDRFAAATILTEDPKDQVVEGDAVRKS